MDLTIPARAQGRCHARAPGPPGEQRTPRRCDRVGDKLRFLPLDQRCLPGDLHGASGRRSQARDSGAVPSRGATLTATGDGRGRSWLRFLHRDDSSRTPSRPAADDVASGARPDPRQGWAGRRSWGREARGGRRVLWASGAGSAVTARCTRPEPAPTTHTARRGEAGATSSCPSPSPASTGPGDAHGHFADQGAQAAARARLLSWRCGLGEPTVRGAGSLFLRKTRPPGLTAAAPQNWGRPPSSTGGTRPPAGRTLTSALPDPSSEHLGRRPKPLPPPAEGEE